MKKMIAAMFALVLSTAANAEVVFDPESGGTVGKGDVQSACGYNNAELQQAWGDGRIAFEYSETVTTVTDRCLNPAGNTVETRVTTYGASPLLSVNTKGVKQVTGFALTVGSSSTTTTTPEPFENANCNREYAGIETNFSIVTTSGTTSGDGKLYVICDGAEHQIWAPEIVPAE